MKKISLFSFLIFIFILFFISISHIIDTDEEKYQESHNGQIIVQGVLSQYECLENDDNQYN